MGLQRLSTILAEGYYMGHWARLGATVGLKMARLIFAFHLGGVWKDVGDRKRTRLDWKRLSQLDHFSRWVVRKGVIGDYAEFGVWRGGSLYAVANSWRRLKQRSRLLYGFDSFEGLPEPVKNRDGHRLFQGQFRDVDYDDVLGFFRSKNMDSIALVKGWFKDTIDVLDGRRLALCHIDADLYESVRFALENSYGLVSPGGVIVFDDYRHPDCSGATIAVEEFFAGRGERVHQTAGLAQSGWIVKK